MKNFAGLWLTVGLLVLAPLALANEAPEFTLSTVDGKEVSLSDYRGKPLMVHFWGSWCPACKKVQPGLQAIADENKAEGLVLLGVNFAEDEGVDPQAVLTERGHTFTTLVKGMDVVKLYGVKGTPTTFFISRDGEVAGISNAYKPDDPELRELAASIL